MHRIAVGGGFQEIDLHRQFDLAHQVRDEDEGAAQEAHDDQLVGAVEMRRDLARQGLDPRRDSLCADHLVDHIGAVGHGLSSGCCGPFLAPKATVA